MEQGIAWIMNKWRARERVFPLESMDPSAVAEMKSNLAEYLEECKEKACLFCKQEPCVWLSNHNSILTWDTLEQGDLSGQYAYS